jgi:hypothetical protein
VLVSFVHLVAGIAEDLAGFGCAVDSSVVEDPVDSVAAESVAVSLLDTAGFDKVVAELAAVAAIAAAVVAAIERLVRVKESLGKQEDRRQH